MNVHWPRCGFRFVTSPPRFRHDGPLIENAEAKVTQ